MMLLYAGACIEERCDPDQEYSKGLCIRRAATAPGPDDGDASPAGGEGGTDPGSDAATGRTYVGFGDPCTDETNHSDCTGDARFCGLATCTAIDCLEDETVCPPDWVCYDILSIMPTSKVASACVPPGLL